MSELFLFLNTGCYSIAQRIIVIINNCELCTVVKQQIGNNVYFHTSDFLGLS